MTISTVLEGITDIGGIAEELRCSVRTARRLDLPTIKVGGRTFYRIEAVRAWLLEHERLSRPEPTRGRPRRAA